MISLNTSSSVFQTISTATRHTELIHQENLFSGEGDRFNKEGYSKALINAIK